MAKKNSMKRALIFGATSMALTASMFVGTTFAWFTDSVTSSNNIIQSGNLDVELYYQQQGQTTWTKVTKDTNVFKNALWEPGHTEVVKLKVVNEGSLALKYQLGVNIYNEVGSVNVYGESFKLSDYIQYGIVDGEQTYATRAAAIQAAEEVKATKLNVAYNSGTQTLLSAAKATQELDDEDTVTMVVYMPTTVDNKANPAKNAAVPTINLGINLLATQVEAEDDSFGTDHDKDAWVDGFEVGTANDLQAALNNGEKNIVLTKDIVATETIVIPAPTVATMSTKTETQSTPVVINLNGKKITANLSSKQGAVIKNNGNAVIEGKDAIVSNTAVNGSSVIVNNGKLVLNGGTYQGAPSNTDTGTASYAINTAGAEAELELNQVNVTGRGALGVTKGASVVVNGGTYHTPAVAWGHAVYATNENTTVVINGGTFSEGYEMMSDNWGMYQIYSSAGAKVTVYGGTFMEWDCANGYDLCTASGGVIEVYGGTFAEDPSSQNKINYLAPGYTTAKNADGTYTVYFPQESVDNLFENATAGATVEIPVGNYSFPANKIQEGMTVKCAEGAVFSGTSSLNVNGATVVGATFKNVNGQAVSGTVNGTFVDCTFEGSETLRWCYTTAGTTTVFENCVIKTDFRGFHFDQMEGDVIFRNCEINGFNAYSGTGTVTFEDCKFGSDRSRYNGLNIYTNTNLVDCTFDFKSGKTNFIDMEGTDKTLNIQNCTATLNGNAVPVESFVGGSEIDNNAVVVDGVRFVKSSAMLKSAIEANVEEVLLADGDYSLRFTNHTNYNVDNMTITGIGENVTLSISSSEAWYGRIQGNNVTFENIKFAGTVGATGKATYNNCTFSGRLECASSGQADTYVNNCTVNVFHTSVDLNSGNAYVKNSTITGTEYSGGKTMYFEECTIGELISWNTSTVLTNCEVTTLDASHMTTNAIMMDGKRVVSTNEALKVATVANTTVFMQDGEYVMDTSTNNVTFVGASEENTKINYTIQHSGVKQGSIWNKTNFKNLTFVNTVFTMAEGGNSTFENVTFAAGFRRGYGTAVQFAGCTFGSNTEGYALHFETDSKSTNGVIVLNNCEFEGGKVHLGGARSYAFTGCDFAAGTDFQAWGNVTLIGCTVDGVAITADNIASFFPNLNTAKVSFGA